MNWIELRALHQLYTEGSVKLNNTIEQSAEINFLLQSLRLLEQKGSRLITVDGFTRVYEQKFKSRYLDYLQFLQDNDLQKPQTRFEESDIRILIKIKEDMDNGELTELRQQIMDCDESVKGVSLMFFRNEKYLRDKPAVVDALKKILNVTDFSSDKDQQYMYHLNVTDPVAIVLCENFDFLTKHRKPRKHRIELWYAGGKNVNKLQYSNHRCLPVYYSCDWDYDGLFVIYPLVKKLIPAIQLLFPTGMPKSITETEHKSLWPQHIPSNIEMLFNPDDVRLINALIKGDNWVTEESNDLVKMLKIS